MPLNVQFNYPAPVPKPKPVKAVLDSVVTINLRTNEVAGFYREYLQPIDESGVPLPDAQPTMSPDRKPFSVFLSDVQLQQILGIVQPEAEVQGALVAGSTPVINVG